MNEIAFSSVILHTIGMNVAYKIMKSSPFYASLRNDYMVHLGPVFHSVLPCLLINPLQYT